MTYNESLVTICPIHSLFYPKDGKCPMCTAHKESER